MKISPFSSNNTEPLPLNDNINNRVYEYNPFNCSDRSAKRARCISQSKSSLHNLKYAPEKQSIRRRRRYSPSAPQSPLGVSTPYLSDLEFSLSSFSSESDLESLPDLTSDETTPLSSPIRGPGNKIITLDFFNNEKQKPIENKKPGIFDIPEIVYKIIEIADLQNSEIPQEITPPRRKPLNYNHAYLIHGSEEAALRAMRGPETNKANISSVLYNCLQVNRLFHLVAEQLLEKRCYFSDERKFEQYLEINTRKERKSSPKMLVLHKLFHTKQKSLEKMKHCIEFTKLEWIEFYMCPKLYPTSNIFKNGINIKKVIITGSKTVDNDFLIFLSKRCPNLEVIDFRACELISDAGIYHIAKNCSKLVDINFGRKSQGNLITDHSISKLVKNNKNLNTFGLAGCHITDRAIWDLAINCSESLQRLSLNNCPYITDQSIPLILRNNCFRKLSVLELRFTKVSNFIPIIEFKRRREFEGTSFLLELCEDLLLKMREQEIHMDKAISERIFKDILDWANDTNDGDIPYKQFIASRKALLI